MPRKHRSELTAGIFVAASLGLVLAIVLWIGAAELFRPSYQEAIFYVREDENPGLQAGSSIKAGGIDVGRIIRVHLDLNQGRAYYIAQITRKGVTIHADSATYVSAGLVGSASLAVTPGSKDAPLADWDHPVHIGGGLDAAMQDIASAASTLRRTIETEFDLTNAESLIAKVHTTADGMSTAAGNVAQITANLVPETDATNPDSLMGRIKSGAGNIDELAGKLYETADEMAKLLVGAQQVIVKVNEGQGTMGKLIVDDRLHRQLLDTTEQLTLLLKDMRALLNKWKKTGLQLKLK
ncbi:hypothetical protein LCGC14_0432120 [marine sediment metagenome]|uniref:Mce/MlaD domain-containing protein n=1 Tax=marine sediment metagenome TaxID=412755 RepID=A0A0F9V9Y0_9ZZZZ|nr:hypothetical protein [Phycisphaerae bacterium]HDZ44350.1 hypothetical protein [Phycisphaerae bacterium]